MAARFDLDRLELISAPVVIIEGIRQPYSSVGAFGCSNSGTCVYVAGTTLREHTVALVDRTGASETLSLRPNSYAHPRFSPKGDKLVLWIQQLRCWIEVYDLTRGSMRRITSEGDNHHPVWTADGQRVVYISRKPGTPDYAFYPRRPIVAALKSD
jgi:Tol biopolymer transport system component